MRPEILFPLFGPVGSLRGVGARVAPLLERVAGPRVRDLIFLPPQGLIHRRRALAAQIAEGEVHTLTVTIDAHLRPGRTGQPWRIRAFDATGAVILAYF